MPSTSCKCQNPYIARLQEDVSGYRHSTLSRTNSLSLYCHFLFETLYIHTCCKVLRMSGFQLVESQYLAQAAKVKVHILPGLRKMWIGYDHIHFSKPRYFVPIYFVQYCFWSSVQTAIDNFLSNFFETVLISGQFRFFHIIVLLIHCMYEVFC